MKYFDKFMELSLIVLKPNDFFKKIKSGEIKFFQPAIILISYIFLSSFFLAFKPFDFPKDLAPISAGGDFFFYLLNYFIWGIPGIALFSLFSVFWIHWMKGRFPLKFITATLIMAFAFICARIPSSAILKNILALILVSLSVILVLKNKQDFEFAMKSVSAAYLIPILFIPFSFLAVFLANESFFTVIEAVSALWLFAIYIKIGKFISECHSGKLLSSYFLSMLSVLIFFYTLYEAGIMSAKSFKALLLM